MAGFCITDKDFGAIDTTKMTASLAIDMQTRGSDATGIVTVSPKGRVKLRKKPIPAHEFLKDHSGIGGGAQTCIIHTRAATQGHQSVEENNHPILYGNILGAHNGIVYNDDDLFQHFNWKRHGRVDSEAIFAAIDHLDDLREALEHIDASWAIAWLQLDQPKRLWLARGYQSPLFYAQTENGSLVFASTEIAVKAAFKWGGISGEPFIVKADEGFLANITPDTGLTILPSFDGSGDKATIGKRVRRSYTSYLHGYEDWQAGNSLFTSKQTVQTKPAWPWGAGYMPVACSDPHNPEYGDIRKKWDPATKAYKEERFVRMQGDTQVWTSTKLNDWDDWDEPNLGIAEIGDTISIQVDLGERIYGRVVDINDGDVDVEWEPSTLSRCADYRIEQPAMKGA